MGVIRFMAPLFPDCAPNPINSTTLACQNGIQTWSAIINSWITVVWLQAGKEILGLLDREKRGVWVYYRARQDALNSIASLISL